MLVPGSERVGPCDLENALRNFRGYASDNIQTRYAIDESSTGSVDVYTDGSLGNDAVVMVFNPYTDIEKVQRMSAILIGGQTYIEQIDTCWFDGPRIDAYQCSVIDSLISEVD